MLIVGSFLLPTLLIAQSNNNSNRPERSDPTRAVAIDELGLRLALENATQNVKIDPQNYTVGVNDVFSIEVTGAVSLQLRGLVVNPMGDIVIPEVSTVPVTGIRLDSAIDSLKKVVSAKFRNSTIRVSLELARPVHITLSGSIPNPGKFQVPYGTTVDMLVIPGLFPLNVSAQMQTGETFEKSSRLINSEYDLRNIRIVSENGSQRIADLLAYNFAGISDSNPTLRDGDVIHISRLGRVHETISISGAVHNSLTIPFNSTDSISKLIQIAGGLTPDSFKSHVFVQRLSQNGSINSRVDSTDFSGYQLQPYDVIVIESDPIKRQIGTVRVEGEVKNPGRFTIREGQTSLHDLIKNAGGLTELAMSHAVRIDRLPKEIDEEDPFESRLKPENQYPSQLLRNSDQYREGFEMLQLELDMQLQAVFADLRDTAATKDIMLFNNDRIVVPKDEGTVLLMGQISNPGYVPLKEGDSVDSIILSVGGLSEAADSSRIFVIKSSTKEWRRPSDTTVESGDIIFVDRKPLLSYQLSESLDLERQSTLLQERQVNLQRRSSTFQIAFAAIGTVASVITTYLLITQDN